MPNMGSAFQRWEGQNFLKHSKRLRQSPFDAMYD